MTKEQAITIRNIQEGATGGRPSYIVRYGVEGRVGDTVFNLTTPIEGVFKATPRVAETDSFGGTSRYEVNIVPQLATVASVHMRRGRAELVQGDDAITDHLEVRGFIEGKMGEFGEITGIARVAAAAIETPLSREPDERPETFQERLVVTYGRTRMSPPQR